MTRTAVVLLTRDLRLHDQPALAAACANFAEVVPLFVLDPALAGLAVNRHRFLAQSLADLRESLQARGGDLVLRRGDPVAETIKVARAVDAAGVALSADVSRYARRRERRLARECERHRMSLRLFPGVTVVDPGALQPAGGDHFKVFSPYHRAWLASDWRTEVSTPKRITLPPDVSPGRLPGEPRGGSPDVVPGGERAGRDRLRGWLKIEDRYDDLHDDLAGDGTSRLSPYLRFGCLSPLAVARSVDRAGPFARQLAWRDFNYQTALARPDLAEQPLRPRSPREWRHDEAALAAWSQGRTGVPIVDAGMRQLRAEGWMHNRARLITAYFLTRNLGLDWRSGLKVFGDWLVDGDVPNNAGNWQWVAGTGADTRPNRGFNPIRQAERYDPDGEYVRRYVPELADVPELAGKAVHQPWKLPPETRRRLDYPPPLGM
ncbi:cryptochrome/photolyase family protein [Plantactinospora siamensis]|uniref:Cryptochrome/photolyase family protein n=1 Tax=Plantactinospora siamensis TaxID=555372 RepID=A0ABV6NT96_9ACTN